LAALSDEDWEAGGSKQSSMLASVGIFPLDFRLWIFVEFVEYEPDNEHGNDTFSR